MRHLLHSYAMSNLILNILKVLKDEIEKKEYTSKRKFSKKELRTVVSEATDALAKLKRRTFFINKRTL